MDLIMKQWYYRLDDERRYQFDERCGIREFQGGMTRELAERLTYREYHPHFPFTNDSGRP